MQGSFSGCCSELPSPVLAGGSGEQNWNKKQNLHVLPPIPASPEISRALWEIPG